MANLIELKCAKCGNTFQKEKKEFTRQTKSGQVNFYCGFECTGAASKRKDAGFNYILRQTKKSATKRSREWDLSLGFLKKLWEEQGGKCSYTKKDLILPNQSLKSVPHSASLDRIDSDKGYVVGNVEYVSLFINLGKNGFSKDQVKEFLDILG